jgi:DNA repair protein RecO
MIVTTEAIILKSLKYRDTSKILTAYTQEFGRCSVVANGARQAKNKFGSALDVGACSLLTFYKHPNKDLHTLSGAETARPMRQIMDSFDKLTVALSMLEAMYTTQHDEELQPDLYTLLRASLSALNACENNEHTVLMWFHVQLAEQLGFALNPSVCASFGSLAGEPIRPDAAPEFLLSLANGAPFAPELNLLGSGQQAVFKVEAGTLAVLQHLHRLQKGKEAIGDETNETDETDEYTTSLQAASKLVLHPRQQQQLGDFFALYYQYHIERNITSRTRKFLRDV